MYFYTINNNMIKWIIVFSIFFFLLGNYPLPNINNKSIIDKVKRLRLHGMTTGAQDRYSGKYRHWDMDMLANEWDAKDLQDW